MLHLHDFTNLLQVLAPLIIGILTWRLNSKNSDHDYIKEENDRLNSECKRLRKENDDLRKELHNHDN